MCAAAGVTSLASVSGDLDLGTHDGQLMARLLGAFGRKESDDKSRRIRRKALELAQAGKVGGGGTRPYGFEDDRVTVRRSEAVVVQQCARRFLAGESIRSICSDLNERGIATATGTRAWSTQTLRRLLYSPRICGQREHQGTIIGPAVWPAIITPAEGMRIRAILDDPARRTNRTARRYLLTRLLRCGLCGEALVSRPNERGVARYVCARGPNFSGCGKMYARADSLEAFVVEAILYRLDSPEFAAALARPSDEPAAAQSQLEVDQSAAQLAELAETYGRRVISLPEWLAAREPIEQRLTTARKQLASLNRTTALGDYVGNGGVLRERWQELPLTRQRAIVAALLAHVVVQPGRRGFNRFDPSRFTPVWRI